MNTEIKSSENHLAFFAENESGVRAYCRRLPALLRSADQATITDVEGRCYIDFLSACGALNYGHNHPHLRSAAINYLTSNGIAAALDFHTEAKLAFMSAFRDRVLQPRELSYRMQFPGPTGSNCVEAAIKLARKVTGKGSIVAFTNAFHGVSLGALSATASSSCRQSAQGLLSGVIRLPYEGYAGADRSDLARFEAMALDPSGGIDPIAAIIVETVQGEGGLNVASIPWLRALAALADRLGALLIVDDIQAGCGRTGTFFSFERARIVPDIVCLAKSIGGYGFPMSLLLMRPELDLWSPGEHNGTFRGNSLAFVTARAALDLWTEQFKNGLEERSEMLTRWCASMAAEFPSDLRAKGMGMMQGVQFLAPSHATEAARLAMASGIIVECCGPRDEVLKVMAPLNIDLDLFSATLSRLGTAVRSALRGKGLPRLERDEAVLDPHNHCCDAIPGAQLFHSVANMELHGFLRDA